MEYRSARIVRVVIKFIIKGGVIRFMKKSLVFLICFLVLLGTVEARSLESHVSTIDIDDYGNADVKENYVMFLEEVTGDFSLFEDVSRQAKNDITVWQTFLPIIEINAIGDVEELLISSFKQRGFGYVNLEYKVPGFSKVISQQGRFTIMEIDEDEFKFYNESSVFFTIHSKTTLWIKFNKNFEIIENKPSPTLGPYVADEEKIVMGWTGPSHLNEFSTKYKVERGISESFGMTRILDFFVGNPVYGIVVVILIILIVIYRRQIAGLISEGFAGEEEIEAPKKEL